MMTATNCFVNQKKENQSARMDRCELCTYRKLNLLVLMQRGTLLQNFGEGNNGKHLYNQ